MPSLRVGRTDIPYALRRSATISERRITVTPDGVEVLALTTDNEAEIAGFLHRKREWLFQSVRELQDLTTGRAVVPRFMTGSKVPYRGRRVSLTVRRTDRPHTEVSYRNGLIVELAQWVSDEQAEAVVSLELKLWLKRRVRLDVEEIAAAYGKKFGLLPRAIRTVDLASGWGSCGQEGTITINWTLVLAPKRVLEYVVVHELAHLRHRSHGRAFWAFVETLMPDFAAPKSWLEAHQGALGANFLDSASVPWMRKLDNARSGDTANSQ